MRKRETARSGPCDPLNYFFDVLESRVEAGAETRVEAPVLGGGAPASLGAEDPLSRLASLSSSLLPTEPRERLFGHESPVLQMKTRFVEYKPATTEDFQRDLECIV